MPQVIRVFFRQLLGVTVQTRGRRKDSFMNDSVINHDGHWVYCAYITRNGKIIYPKNAKVFKFWVSEK